MEIKVVLDKSGQMVAAIYKGTPMSKEPSMPSPEMGPVLEEGQTLVELGVADEYATYPLDEFVERLTVEAKAKLAKSAKKK